MVGLEYTHRIGRKELFSAVALVVCGPGDAPTAYNLVKLYYRAITRKEYRLFRLPIFSTAGVLQMDGPRSIWKAQNSFSIEDYFPSIFLCVGFQKGIGKDRNRMVD